MITYVDTSTLVKLVVNEPGSDRAEQIWMSADALVAVSLIEVETHAALAAAHRGNRLTTATHRRAVAIARELFDQIATVEVTSELITSACGFAQLHGLRGYDAVHLAAARLVDSDILTSADTDLCEAASREGIHVANPLDA